MDPSACSSPAPCDLPPAQALQPQNLVTSSGIGNNAGPRVTRVMWGRYERHLIQTVAVSRSFSVPFINTTPPGLGAAEWYGGLARVAMYLGCVQTTSASSMLGSVV